MATQIDDYLSRPRRYENIDGLIEVMWGVTQLNLAAFFWLSSVTPSRSFWSWVELVCSLLLTRGLFVGRKYIKRHVTHVRTGFAKPVPCAHRWQKTVVFFLVMAATAVADFVLMRHSGRLAFAAVWWAAQAGLYGFATRLDQLWEIGLLLVMTFGWRHCARCARSDDDDVELPVLRSLLGGVRGHHLHALRATLAAGWGGVINEPAS